MSSIFPETNETTIEEIWQPYLKFGEKIYIKKNSIIYNQGEIGAGIYFLSKGLIKIITYTPEGMERILDLFGPNRLFGEQAIDQQYYFSSAKSLEDSVLIFFHNRVLRGLLISYPELINPLMESLTGKIRMLAREVMMKDYSAEQRIAAILLKLSQVYHRRDILITQQDLADYTGVTRISVYKVLKKWKETQIIDTRNKIIQIRKPELLMMYSPLEQM